MIKLNSLDNYFILDAACARLDRDIDAKGSQPKPTEYFSISIQPFSRKDSTLESPAEPDRDADPEKRYVEIATYGDDDVI